MSRMLDSITSRLKKKHPPVSPAAGSTPVSQTPSPPTIKRNYNDRERTRERYEAAATLLEESLKHRQGHWGSFEFPELSGEPEKINDSQFRRKIELALESRRNSVKDRTGWSKGKDIVECIFTALSPLSKNFLTIAKEGQAIPVLNPYGLICGGLLLLITIADREIARKEEISKMLDYICQQVEQLAVAENLPHDLEQREAVINRALDVRSASMQYLAVHICHDSTPLAILGKSAKVFLKGDKGLADASSYLTSSVDSYNKALSHINLCMNIKMYELLRGSADLKTQTESQQTVLVDDKFLIPYQQNPRFIGRTELLRTLKGKLYSQAPMQYNHRIALYGMGGVGKTQTALEYVYVNKTSYDRIYWITAVNQASLLAGYQKISETAGLKIPTDLTLVKIAKVVLSWLRSQGNWLIVIDNLDGIEVISGFLPENGSDKHTLITTRNPNSEGIPAQGLEIPLFTPEESVALFIALSKVPVASGSPEEKQAGTRSNWTDVQLKAIDQNV